LKKHLNQNALSSEQIVLPFLKWAGGKRWLTAKYPDLIPKTFDRYVEPFLGSGAVFFFLQPQHAILSDSNSRLIQTYEQVQQNWKQLRVALKRHHNNHGKEYYYQERARARRVAHEQAAQFIYLNRTCWNGLYRVNQRGEFNVPIGTKTSVILSSDNFEEASTLLRNAKLHVSDFETAIRKAHKGDFVFVDPPYVTRHNYNGFVKYNDKIFSWEDQERLAASVSDAAARGAKVLVTNAAHESVRKLYGKLGRQLELERNSVLAADSANRGKTTEVAIAINYPL
jgi:DNA adenine methylase